MQFFNSLIVATLAASSLPAAMAAKCKAVGAWSTNSEGWGFETIYADTQSIQIFRDGTEIGHYDLCDTCKGVCSDFINVDSQLPSVFEWGASCDTNGFRECHGAYGSQTHIVGDKPTNDQDYYGLGVNDVSTCTVEFDCEG